MEYCKCFNQSAAALMKINQKSKISLTQRTALAVNMLARGTGWVVHPEGYPSLLFKGLELASDLGWSCGGSCVCVCVGVQMEAAELSTSQA